MQGLDPKGIVYKYKNRKNYRRNIGHRPVLQNPLVGFEMDEGDGIFYRSAEGCGGRNWQLKRRTQSNRIIIL
ncbi:hypothetical protein IFM89_036105 [Coptis chinensis]|uniref:Uncharacterized protein n=1 Tax=Coptis chinensis TaxID=261450 RepID=A0A835MBK9_9MAGN|nr:hypothetical protein IFM89_036105 [Coptis chinensis]